MVMQNPFRFRASEQATRDDQFLSLVGPYVLEMLPADQLWDRLVIIESAPGAGKTTILRLFTPNSLRSLQRLSEQEAYRPLSQQLRRLGVLTSEGPTVIGVLVNCREQYATIQDIPVDQPTQLRWFFGLLDARVTLLTLRSILVLHGLTYPGDVGRLEARPNEKSTGMGEPINGMELYNRASDAERSLTNSLNSLVGVNNAASYLVNGLQSLRFLSTCDLFLDDAPLTEQLLVMFDDVHELTSEQREALRRDLEQRDLAVGRWLARRSQALEPVELLASARTKGRDFEEVQIEEWAQGGRGTGRRFFDLLDEIGNRRTLRAQIDVETFDSCLMADSTNQELQRASEARDTIRDQVYGQSKGQLRFSEWIEKETEAIDKLANPIEAAVRWRKLLIMMQYRLGRGQLPLDIPLPLDELEARSPSAIETAAELFLAKEYRLPFYYGARRIKQLSSWNIEQYLRVAGDLFEQVLASRAVSRNRSNQLSATQQDSLLRTISEERLSALVKEVPFGPDVQRLVEAIGNYCQQQTHRPTAPYAPGMTGVGISNTELHRLTDGSDSTQESPLNRLSRAITSAIANNVLEVRQDVNVKGGTWTVFHLNRLYCPAFYLPLGYSGYKQNVGVDALSLWVAHGSQGERAMGFDL